MQNQTGVPCSPSPWCCGCRGGKEVVLKTISHRNGRVTRGICRRSVFSAPLWLSGFWWHGWFVEGDGNYLYCFLFGQRFHCYSANYDHVDSWSSGSCRKVDGNSCCYYGGTGIAAAVIVTLIWGECQRSGSKTDRNVMQWHPSDAQN